MNTLYITESMMSESSLWEVKGLHNSGKTQGQKDLQMRTDAAGLMTICTNNVREEKRIDGLFTSEELGLIMKGWFTHLVRRLQ